MPPASRSNILARRPSDLDGVPVRGETGKESVQAPSPDFSQSSGYAKEEGIAVRLPTCPWARNVTEQPILFSSKEHEGGDLTESIVE